METLLNQGASVSELAFLRILQLVHAQTTTLVDDLKTQELPVVVPRSPIDSSEFRRAIGGTGAAAAASGSNAAMGVMLDSAMEELFATYTEGQRYLDKECKCLTDLYAKLLSAFARYHVRYIYVYVFFFFLIYVI
jgi:exocyst complex component 5